MIRYLYFLLFSFITFSGNSIPKNSHKAIKKSELVRPPSLKKGDSILIIAPAGKIQNQQHIQAGIDLAQSWGLAVKFGHNLFKQYNSFAGTEKERLSDLQKGLDNPNIKMIWAARGGYGTVRIIDDLNFTKFKKHPKWIVGFSDITVLHNKTHNLGFQTIHGQMPSTIDLRDSSQQEAIASLKNTLFGKKIKYVLDANKNNKKGKAQGILVGGNLSILCSMLGSNTSIDTRNKIIFIEDVSEPLYNIDRMIISLERAGYFKNAQGLIVGDFSLKPNESNPFGKTLEKIVIEALNGTDFPIIFDFPAGHLNDNRAIILGREIKINCTSKKAAIVF
jgi:muramoyltetrapeptide carboxypeptidase